MATDPDRENIRELVSDLETIDKDLDLMKRRVKMIKRDLLIAIGDRKPVVQNITEMIAGDGSRVDLSKYREGRKKKAN